MNPETLVPPAGQRFAIALIAALSAIPTPSAATCDPQALFGSPIPYVTGPNPAYLVSRDFNEDGIPDLAVTNTDYQNGGVNNSVAILRGTGGLNYAAPVLYPVQLNPHMVTAGDFNEDGITDLVSANKWSSTVSILLGKGAGGVGDGTFAGAVNYPTGGYPFQIVVEDFDRDGIDDLAVSLNSVYAVALLRGSGKHGVGSGTFDPPVSLALSNYSTGLERGDFDLDGITDLVATENYSGTVAFLRGTGSPVLGAGSFAAATHIAAGPLPFELAVADFNEDGKPDLAVAEQTTGGGTGVMLGNGNGTFQPPTFLPTGNTVVVTPDDLNQDGITDLAIGTITGSNGGNVRIYLGNGTGGVGDGTFGNASSYTQGDTYQILPGDFDGDGRRDLAVSYYLTTSIRLLPGTCSGGPPPADPRAPVLTDVRDVPNDHGGRVFLTWTASSLDIPGGAVNAYRVWRRIPPALLDERVEAGVSREAFFARQIHADAPASSLIDYWEAIVTLPAQRLEGYGYTAPTTQDSIAGSNPYTAFFVTALTPDIDVFYSSNVDSGYSVDNLPPDPPAPFTARYDAGQVVLEWGMSGAADFSHFRLYRGSEAGFTPGPDHLVLTTSDTGFVDTSPAAPGSYYKLSALDVHGNESQYALTNPTLPTGVDGTQNRGLALRQPVPNPGDGRRFVVEFTLASASPARLEVHDVAGRMVFARDVGGLGPGAHRIDLAEGSPFRAGLYFMRLTQGGLFATARAAVIR